MYKEQGTLELSLFFFEKVKLSVPALLEACSLPFLGGADEEELIQEREMLEELPLPGRRESEAERKSKWLELPRPARAAIRRMHNQFGHKLKEPLIEILRASHAPDVYIKAAKYLRCADFDRKKILPVQTRKVEMAPPYKFNHTLGFDMNHTPDADGVGYQFLNMVCIGTDFQLEVLLQQGERVG